MLQKTQWTLAASALAVGALLATGARPAQAQVRIHLTRPVTSSSSNKTGIVIPPSSPLSTGNTISTTPKPITSTQTTQPTPAPKPTTSTQTTQPTPAPKPTTNTTTTNTLSSRPTTSQIQQPLVQSAPQGFSAGPSLLGEQRLPLGRVVNRVGPDINSDGFPDVRKDPRSR
jgi:hypothetical protein